MENSLDERSVRIPVVKKKRLECIGSIALAGVPLVAFLGADCTLHIYMTHNVIYMIYSILHLNFL
jgi:hypothetical protein